MYLLGALDHAARYPSVKIILVRLEELAWSTQALILCASALLAEKEYFAKRVLNIYLKKFPN